ncbi:unnamed protein product, partial [Brenthis ino]
MRLLSQPEAVIAVWLCCETRSVKGTFLVACIMCVLLRVVASCGGRLFVDIYKFAPSCELASDELWTCNFDRCIRPI